MSLNHTSEFSQLTDEQFAKIGRIVVEWANIESLCKQLLANLLLLPDFPARTLTDRMNAFSVQEAINESLDLHIGRYGKQIVSSSQLERIKELNKQVHDARANRNKFAHFCWCRSNDEEIFGTNFSAGLPESKKYRRSSTTMSNTQLDELYQASHQLVELLREIIAELIEVEEEAVIKLVKQPK